MNESALICTTFCVLKWLVCPLVCLPVYPELLNVRLHHTGMVTA